jgi:hypothetical protein
VEIFLVEFNRFTQDYKIISGRDLQDAFGNIVRIEPNFEGYFYEISETEAMTREFNLESKNKMMVKRKHLKKVYGSKTSMMGCFHPINKYKELGKICYGTVLELIK